MFSSLFELLVLLNPFALFLYLLPIMKELDDRTFNKVLIKASFISLFIFFLFLFTGDSLLEKVFKISFESFRIFGGIIIFSLAYLFIIKGGKALIKLKGDIDELASEIALPFMVGVGTISIVIIIGFSEPLINGSFILCLTLFINYLVIMFLKKLRAQIKKKKYRQVFDHNMEILLRLNSFFVGAIGVNMVLSGLTTLFF
ncbi:MAG TPA: MarC family protein [Patescibacteria group bacterium]|nr:MarC family protein [Patescibacteria group bacterium]